MSTITMQLAPGNWRNEDRERSREGGDSNIAILLHQNPSFKAVLFTRAPTLSLRNFEHSILLCRRATGFNYPVNDTNRRQNQPKNRPIAIGIKCDGTFLVVTVLGAVAVETEGLVGHELLGAGVDGSTDGDTAMELRQRECRPTLREWEG